MSDNNVIVTGGAGFIGSNLCKILSQKGYNPVSIDDLSSGFRSLVKYGQLIEGDISDYQKMTEIFSKYNPLAVFHIAGSKSVEESARNPYKYYENSLKEIIKKTNNTFVKILYFCEKEDNEEIEKLIDILKKTITNCAFIKVTDDVEDWKQLILMSACGNNIIANSSFSWWGAYLNTNPTKIVCYPEIWFGPKVTHDTRDLFPESWTKISCV